MSNPEQFMWEAIRLSFEGMRNNKGGPFGTVIVKDGEIIATGTNEVTSSNDPTAHGEIVALRHACKKLNTFQLTGCELYTNSEPCPMCFSAICWARPDKVYFANTVADAAKIGFDDVFISDEMRKEADKRQIPYIQLLHDEALSAFEEWEKKTDKIQY
jgi:guanine deaminase